GKYVRNLSASWDAEKTYAKVVGYESANVADDVQADIARYDLFIRVQNIDRAWDVSIVYVKLTQIALTERPADWSTAYSSYYVKNNGVYAPNTSNVWHDDYEYAYLGYVSVSEQPADWESDYASYWRLIAAPEWYKPGQKVTVTELTLFVNSDIRVAAKFSKDTFKAEVVVVGGNPGIITIGQAEPAVGSYKMDEIKFEYHSKIGISLRAESIPDGQSIRSISVYINKNDGLTFNLLDYDGLMTEDFDPLLNTDTYEYGVNGFVTDENYIGNIFVVVTMTSIQYKISYVVYTDLDSLADLSENNKITLDWAENATEGSFYELRNKFRIGYNVSFNLNNFLSGDETLSLLTDAQVAGIGGGARNDFLVVNWFLDQPTAATVQGDILQTYKHVKKDVDHPVGNIVVYGLLLNLFRLQVTSNEVALGFNKYVTDAFNNVYDRNISSLVVPTVFRDKNQDVVRNVTRYGFTSDTTNEQYYFSNNGKIKSLTFGESLEYVSFRAFNGCTALTTVTMAEGVCEIGGEAFKGCSSLSEINFPVSLIRFGDSAFSGTALTSVTIGNELPAGYTETRVYGAEVFSNIPTLAEVHFNANTKNTDAGRTTSITGGGLFRNSGSGVVGGMTLYVEGNVNYLDSNLFGYKQGQSGNGMYLKNVVFAGSGSSVEIPAGAFRMTGLTSVTIGSRVSSVGENAFRECTSLAEVVFADDCALTTIADRCFYFCTLLNEIVLPVGVTSIGNSAFAGTGSLTAVYYPMTGIASALTQIGENAFGSGENSAGTLTVRSGLKRFLPVSQKGVTGNNVEIPSSVTSIGKSAFACSAIERLILGGNNLAIGQKAFYDLAETVGANKHSTLTYLEYNVSGTVTIDCPVGEEADIFSLALTTTLGENCSIVIGSSTAQIPSVFFKGMTVATSLTIGANVTTIGEKAFYGMTGLTTVNYNAANVTGTTIATLAFGGSGNNATIVFGKSVKNLPDYLFKGANGIKYLDFSPVTSNDASASLTVGTGVFDGLTQITSIEFFKMRALTLKDGALLGMNALTSLTIAQDIGTFTVGMNSINKDTSFTVLSFPGFTFSNQRYPLEITEGTFVTAYDNGAHNYTLSVNSEMYTSAAGTFSVARGDSLTVAGTIRLRTHLYVYGTMDIGNSGGNVIRETGGVTGNIYGCVYTEDDLIGKNASGTVYTHLKQMDSFALTANIDLSEKTEYQLPANITLTVNAGKVLSVGKRFICDGHVVVNGKLALASKEIVNLAGDVTVAANAGFSVGDKIYLARSAEGSGLYIDSGNVVLTALPSEAQYALNGGIYFTVNGQVHMVDDFDFGGGDVFDIASGSRVTAGYDLTAGIVYVHGDLIVEKSVGMTKPNAYYQSGGSTYDALPNAGEGATPDRNVRLLYSLQDGIHACSSKPAMYLFGVTAQMKDVTAKLKAARKEVSSGVYSALICGTVARQNELLTVAAESADVVFDVDVNYLLPLYACVYTGDELTSVDESVVVGYVLARYNADAEEGKFVCRECGVELTLTADTIYDGEDLRIFVTNDKSLLKLAGQAAPVYFGITLTTVFGDIAAAIDASDYEVYYSGSSYNAETPVANQLVTFEQLYGTFTRNGRSYFLIPLKKAGTSNVAGFIAATYEVTFDANISAPVKVVTNSAVTYYNSLSYAVDKVSSGATLLLTKNYSTDNLVIDKSVTIDLNGFALTMTGGDDLIVVGQENIPTVTIRNGNVIGEGEGGSLLKVAKGSLTVSNGTYSYSGVLFDVTVTSSGLTADHIVATGARLMNASGNATLGFVSFTGTEGIVVSGGQIAIVNSDVTVTGTALTVPKTSNSLASVAVSTTSRYTDLTSTTGVAVKVEGEIFGVTFTGSTRYSVRIEGVNAGIVHSAGTVALQNYVTVTSVLGRSSDVSVQNGAVVLSEPASGNAGITLSISGTGIYLVNSGVDHDAILHYNRRSEIEPVLDFGNRPFVIGAFTELATFDGENNNNDAIFTKARYVFPVYTRQEVSGEYAYLTYSDSLKAVLQPSYSQNDSAVWDNAKLYAFGTMTATTQKPDAWDTSFTDYYLDPLGNVRNTSPEWHSDTIYYYYYFTELTEQPSNWATKYDRYYVLDSKAVYAYIANTSSVWDGEKSYYDAQYNVVSSQPADWASEYASYFVREKKKTYVFTSGSMTLSEKTIIPFDCVLKTSGELYIKADIVVCGEIILTDAVTAELPENVADPIAFRVKETGKVTLSERNKKIGKNSRYVIEGELYVSGCNVTFEDNSSGVSDYVLTVASTGKINVGTGVATASLYVTAGRVKIGGTITNHGNLIFYSTVVIRMEDGSVIENFDTVTFNGKVTIGGEITSVGTLFFRDDVTVDENGGIVCTNNAATVDWIANVHVLGSVDMNGAALTLGSAAKALFYQNSTFNSSGTIDCYGEMVFATVNVSITNGINFYMGGTLLLETTLFTGLESSIVYEEDATSYKLLEEEPSDWATAYGSYYSNPGEPITALVCPTWQEDTYYYNTWSYQKKTATIDLSVNYEHGSTLSVTAVHGYSMLWSKHIVATSCIVRGYTVSDYSKQVAYDYSDTAGALIINVTFEDAGIIHWNIAAELGNHVVMCQNVSGDTELSSFRHRKYCTVCGAEYGEEDHVLGGLSIPEEDTSMVINGASYSYTMVSRTCAKCGKNVLFVYQCAYDTTIGDINNYIANTGFRCSLNGVNASTSIHDALSKMSFTESFDSTGYYLFKASKDDQTVYFLLWYDYDYEYENVPDTNLHAKRWENYEGYYSYEQHSYTSITRETL
ncbi:MAG: leucine-rich repeat protein, partial [Clostridia bacterium]|nr:leucine-rich repeat protein [Clostridia bacterium]